MFYYGQWEIFTAVIRSLALAVMTDYCRLAYNADYIILLIPEFLYYTFNSYTLYSIHAFTNSKLYSFVHTNHWTT